MSSLRDKLVEILEKENIREEELVAYKEMLHEQDERLLYAQLFNILCDVSFAPEEAKEYYERICEHRDEMSRKLGRDLRFRVAMLDYFVQDESVIKNPLVVELRLFEERRKLVLIDELTGVYNRRYIDEALEKELARSSRHSLEFSVLFADIDDFKKVNDLNGHIVGDQVLREFANVMSSAVRKEDVVGRYGGEEFMVLMPETGMGGALTLSARLLNAVRKHTFSNGLSITFSAGAAVYPKHGQNVESLIYIADKGLYFSKYNGKDQINVFNGEKRRERRYNIDWNILFSNSGNISETADGHNISFNGLSFDAKSSASVGDVLDITLNDPEASAELDLLGRVVWVKELNDKEGRYRFGIKFIGDSSHKSELEKRVKELGARIIDESKGKEKP